MINRYETVTLGRDLSSDRSQVFVDQGSSAILLKAIAEACTFAIAALDRNGIVRMWSRGAEEMFGRTESEAVGNPLPIPLEHLLGTAAPHPDDAVPVQRGNR